MPIILGSFYRGRNLAKGILLCSQQRFVSVADRKQLEQGLWNARNSLSSLLIVADKYGSILEAEHITIIFHRLQALIVAKKTKAAHWKVNSCVAKDIFNDCRLHKLLGYLTEVDLHAWTPKQFALVSHSLAALGVSSETFFAGLEVHFPKHLKDCQPQDISNVVHALGKLRLCQENLLEVVASYVCSNRAVLVKFSPQAISNIIYAYGLLSMRHQGMLEIFADHMQSRLHTFNHQNISNAMYGFALLGFKHPGLLQSLCCYLAGTPWVLGRFSPQALCNTLYSLAFLNFLHRGFLVALIRCVQAPGSLSLFASRDLAALASSCVVGTPPPVQTCGKLK